MILIVSHKEDFTTDYLVNILNKKNVKYLRFNTDDIVDKHKILIHSENNKISISIDDVKKFHSVWYRRTKIPSVLFDNIIERNLFSKDIINFTKSIFQLIKAEKWLSNPYKISDSENKLLQLKYAVEIGFKVPNTIISNTKNEIINFYKENRENVILKPLYNGRVIDGENQKLIFTNKLNFDEFLKEEYLSFPILFQENVQKDYEIRVTIVDKKNFSAKVKSQENPNSKIDWRRERLKFEPIVLPNEINKMCFEIVHSLGLNFGAIDLIKDKNGDYIFLEINPNGQWVWIEIDTGLKISDAIIEFLTN